MYFSKILCGLLFYVNFNKVLSTLLVKFSGNDNAGISGHPEGSTPGHPGAFVTAAVPNTC